MDNKAYTYIPDPQVPLVSRADYPPVLSWHQAMMPCHDACNGSLPNALCQRPPGLCSHHMLRSITHHTFTPYAAHSCH